MRIVDVLQEDFDIGSLIDLGGAHLLGDFLRGFLDTHHKGVTKSSLTGALVVRGEYNGLLACHASAQNDDDAPGFEAEERTCG